ncbi:RNA 2',3'-cyclic phosphodiesterase [Microvirga sp. W0021]|uniref:RNA 2',3'-cyclic phosphodiesterase n=1 Tax=Hohaiivirga grylli TaxID=3133970 RepID=A0ABV0BEW7_9HYPH
MPRLFTGLEIPPEVALQLSMLRGGLSGARWIDPENYHITLRFIGDIDRATAHEVFSVLGDCRRYGELTISVGELATFGSDRPRSIIVKIQPNSALLNLQAEQERLLRRVGVAAEARKFVPHVTLARLRHGSPLDVAEYMNAFGQIPRITFSAKRFVLYSSRDSVGGGPYVVEAAYPLA